LAWVAQGDVQAGLAEINRSLEVAIDKSFHVAQLQYLSIAYRMCQDWPALDATAARGVEIARQAGDQRIVAFSLRHRARAAAGLGQIEAAAAYMAELYAEPTGSQPMISKDLFAAIEAEVCLAQRQVDAALTIINTAVDLARRADSLLGEGLAQRVWAQALMMREPSLPDQINTHFASSLRLFQEGEAWLEAAYTQVEWATFCLRQGEPLQAAELLVPALKLFTSAELKVASSKTRDLLRQAHSGAPDINPFPQGFHRPTEG
jgi:hypothetical protein